MMIGLLNDRWLALLAALNGDGVVFSIIDVDMVDEKGRRRLDDLGKSKMAPLLRFWPGFMGGVIVVQQAMSLV